MKSLVLYRDVSQQLTKTIPTVKNVSPRLVIFLSTVLCYSVVINPSIVLWIENPWTDWNEIWQSWLRPGNLLPFFSLPIWQTTTLPESEHEADDLRFYVGETVITHSSPNTVSKNFQTSFARTRTTYQSHCKITQQYINFTLTRPSTCSSFKSLAVFSMTRIISSSKSTFSIHFIMFKKSH